MFDLWEIEELGFFPHHECHFILKQYMCDCVLNKRSEKLVFFIEKLMFKVIIQSQKFANILFLFVELLFLQNDDLILMKLDG